MIKKETLDILKKEYEKYYRGEKEGRKNTSIVYYEKLMLIEIYELLLRLTGTGFSRMDSSDCGDDATNHRNDKGYNT